jgi:hypothetical protein
MIRGTMRWWSIPVSVAAHGVLALVLAGQRMPVRPRPPAAQPIEIALIELPPDVTSVTPGTAIPQGPPVTAGPDTAAPLTATSKRPPRTPPPVTGLAPLDSSTPDVPPMTGTGSLGMRRPGAEAAPIASGSGSRVLDGLDLAPTGPLLILPGQAPPPDPRLSIGTPGKGGRYHKKAEEFDITTHADGSVTFEDLPPVRLYGLGVKFDVTDMVMRWVLDEDPYRYEKARWLDATREQRQAMALEWRREKLDEAMRRMPAWLDGLWRESGRTPAERRELLFRLWDECAETGPDDVVLAARQVRATIERFVRTRLPPGSADAYTDAELERLNDVRSSRRAFAPYRSE